jgi:hypothetical protein
MNSENKSIIIDQGIADLCDYYRKPNMSPNVKSMYRDCFIQYPEQAIKSVIRECLHDGERFPKIKELRLMLQRHVGDGMTLDYDAEDDPRFPVGIMWDAFRLLESGGKDQFKGFCDRVRMPKTDRVRVIAKFKRAHKVPNFIVGENA